MSAARSSLAWRDVTAPPGEADRIRRHLLIVGVADYRPGWDDIRDGVLAETAKAESLFLDTFGYERETFRRIADTTRTGISDGIASWLESIAGSPNDLVTIYHSGHGIVDRSIFRLVTSEIETNRTALALSLTDLVPIIWTGDRNVLLILDTCHSGTTGGEAVRLASRLGDADGGSARGFALHVIASSRSIELAATRAFITALESVVHSGSAGSSQDEFLRPDAVIEHTNRILAAGDGQQHANLTERLEGLFRFLPNPQWDPQLRIGMSPEAANAILQRIVRKTFRTHWGPRARGVSSGDEPGWFFTGRTRAVRQLLRWMESNDGPNGLIVTGRPGSGKSALLARIVTMADSVVRQEAQTAGALAQTPSEELPPVGCVTAAIHARGKTAADVALELAIALGADLASGETDAESIARSAAVARMSHGTIIVDALDEAQLPEQVAAFLRSIVERSTLRVVVALRSGDGKSGLAQSLGKRFQVWDVSGDDLMEAGDIRAYVERYLSVEPTSPYHDASQTGHATQVAEAVARRASGSFLVASITARALAMRESVIDASQLVTLPREVGAAFEFDFQRFTPALREEATAVLGALAFGQGRGLPYDLCAILASTLGQSPYDDQDVHRWLDRAGYYVTRDTEHGVPVLRLFHEEFARFLQARVASRVPNAERGVAQALEATVTAGADGARPWTTARPYVRSYLARHLRAAELRSGLYALVQEPGWISARTEHGDPSPLLRDLDEAIEAARGTTPPDVAAVLRFSLAFGRRMTTAPPLVIDVLAAAGQAERAALIAENIVYGLDRCHAFCLLAQRAAATDPKRTRNQLLKAGMAATLVRGSYRAMTAYWLVRTASALGEAGWARTLADIQVGLTKAMVESAVGSAIPRNWSPDASFGQLLSGAARDVGFTLLNAFTSRGTFEITDQRTRMMEVDHALFWTAMACVASGHREGLETVRQLAGQSKRPGSNLQLQVAALAGDVDYLDQFLPWNGADPSQVWVGTYRGNLALALATAGRTADALRLMDETREHWQPPDQNRADSAKRLAWAFALCDRSQEALDYLTLIRHPEERLRALYHVTEVLQSQGRERELAAAADLAIRLLDEEDLERQRLEKAPLQTSGRSGRLKAVEAAPAASTDRWRHFEPSDFWRLQTWAAWILNAAGRTDHAIALAEAVCAEEINPSEKHSLVRPTAFTESMKGHVKTNVEPNPDRQRMAAVFNLIGKGRLDDALAMAETIRVPRYRSRARAAVAVKVPEHNEAIALWLSAVVDARYAGREIVLEVINRGRTLVGVSEIQPLLEELGSESNFIIPTPRRGNDEIRL